MALPKSPVAFVLSLVTVQIGLGSSQYQYAQQLLPGVITNAVLLQQQSHAACNLGSSWGFQNNVLWVNRGCRGLFQVTYRQ